ncbi:MAG: chromosome segregation protein SMC [Vampirovibrionales bacterium]|nr:chromosome segregation protein SMC [Vampirovibrionales bacterium]
MHIYRIDIDNFKSFAERTIIPFERGFTTVSGPNGSGKSNIIDSVLFCLGLSTSRTMRAEKLSDLINNLSRRKECKVVITFQKDAKELAIQPVAPSAEQLSLDTVSPDEGGDHTITDVPNDLTNTEDIVNGGNLPPVDLTSGEFIQIARRIKGNNSGYTSTYYLNNEPTTLSHIHEVLGQYNVSPGTYNVMMQGDVQSIVNMSPMERRKIVDEIAGVAEFDRKIEQANKELEATGVNIERNTLLLGEIEVRLEQLAGEREHALKYKKLRDEKQQYEGMLLSAKYVDLKKAIQQTQENLANAKKEKAQTQEGIEALAVNIVTTRQELQNLSNEVKKKGEDQQIALKKQIEGLKGHIARKEDAIAFIDEKSAEATQRIARMHEDIRRQQDNIEAIDAEVSGFTHQLKELQGLFETENKAYQKLNDQFDALTGTGGELSIKRADIRKRLGALEDEKSAKKRQLLDIESGIQRCGLEKELRLSRLSESGEKQVQLQEKHRVLAPQLEALSLEKASFEGLIRQTQIDYSKNRIALNEVIGRFNQLNREYLQLDARTRAIAEMSFSRAVDTVLDANFKGVHGTLAQLGSVESEFALSMEIAMGGRVQNIVVDNETIANQGIQHLQKTNAGRATFLPLSKIQPFRNLPPLPAAPGVIDFAFNLLSCDAKFDDVFAYALGDTLIVEDMESAKPLLRKYRMVTLDGSLLEKSGAMTGGSFKAKGQGYFASSQSADQELETLKKKLDETLAEKDRLEKSLTQLELKLQNTQDSAQDVISRHSRTSAEFEGVQAQLEELGAQGGGNALQSADLDEQVNAYAKELKLLQNQLDDSEKAIVACQGELEAVEKQLPSDKIDAIRQEMTSVKFQLDYYDGEMRKVQTSLKSKEMERNFQDVGIKDCKGRIAEATADIENKAKEKTEAEEEIQLTQMQINELEVQTLALGEELRKLQDERDQVQTQLLELEKQKNVKERLLEQLDETLATLRSRQKELEPELAAVSAELQSAGIEIESIAADKLPPADEITGNIQKLSRRMEAMEPVNMLAIDEYDKVSDRRNELSDKIKTLNDEKEAIGLKILGYQELKRTTFMKAFEGVDQNFKSIFAELSDGNGHLLLTNPEDPFAGGLAIYAQPRGKKIQRVEAMSGGEKSLTSLAFVFSLQRYMPAPFYALDEVDQNLDGINAEKLANMVKREAGRAQFVVVSLRKPMLEHSDRTIGVTQKNNGITKVTGIKLRDEIENAEGLSDLIESSQNAKTASDYPLKASKNSSKKAPDKNTDKIQAAS